MPVRVPPSGPENARIMLVGEAPGAEEEIHGAPFVGPAGHEATNMLHEAGIVRAACFITNVCKIRPPGNDITLFFLDKKMTIPGPEIQAGLIELEQEILRVKPNIIIALGDTALWGVTGKRGITAYRGSLLETKWGVKCLPTFHPSNILRAWENRAVAVHDLRRANRESLFPELRYPNWNFQIRPSFKETLDTLDYLYARARRGITPLAVDLETRRGFQACCGLAWSSLDAICIPYLCVEKEYGYWEAEEEHAIRWRLRQLLRHPNVSCTGQNFAYDAQYFAKEDGYVPNLGFDTMVAQSVLFAGTPKDLNYLSALYCAFHQYWKDEGKEWKTGMEEERLWIYNCRDCVSTFEIREAQCSALEQQRLWNVFAFRMQLWRPVLDMMLRGVRIDEAARNDLALKIIPEIEKREQWMTGVLGHPLNVRSPKQMHLLFYQDFAEKVIINRKTKRPTLDDEALAEISERSAILKPLITRIQELRSLGVFYSNFILAPLDTDRRMRCYFNIAGPETYRFSSSENAFGSGTNLQNIPKGDEDNEPGGTWLLPNIRKMFVPDPGYTIFDVDLAGADAQIVAWEADDEKLKEIFRKRIKVHAENAKDLFGALAGPDGKREPYYTMAKKGVHLTNYGGKPPRLAKALGISIQDAERFQARWFQIHPGIREWHRRTAALLQTKREVRNAFGYRRFYFDRIESILPEALAWVPQSSIAHVSEAGLVKVAEQFKNGTLQLLLQVHDSLVGQAPTILWPSLKPQLLQALTITVPYPDPLIIPYGLKTSTRSWGDCADESWGG